MTEMFKINGSDGVYVLLPTESDELASLAELFLGGYISEDVLQVDKSKVTLIQNPAPHWKAAFLVWRNSVILSEAENYSINRNKKFRNKLIELLAYKYNVDVDVLIQIVSELDEAEGFSEQA